MKKYQIVIIVVILLAALYTYRTRSHKLVELELPVERSYQQFSQNIDLLEPEIELNNRPLAEESIVQNTDIDEQVENKSENQEENLGQSSGINLAIPFTSQAPTANWEQPFQDACEEASILMVHYYYQGKNLPSPEQVENILIDMVNWQEENWGGHYDLAVVETADLVRQFFPYRTEVLEDLTAEKIRSFLDRGLPLIVPADGRKLENPFFSGQGPAYHMLVVKGYLGDNFITNDPGTRRGADFVYSSANLMSSIFDWDKNKGQTIGPKRALVLLPD
ncbi:MAG: C39 family peptidase [Patescibacteria group bacterium]|nr:C39 family peptidase [Patescibacteria group bacterium]